MRPPYAPEWEQHGRRRPVEVGQRVLFSGKWSGVVEQVAAGEASPAAFVRWPEGGGLWCSLAELSSPPPLEDRWQTVPLDPPFVPARTAALTRALSDVYGCDGERLLALAHDTLTALAEKAKQP